MAVTVTDLRTLRNDADATTDWTGSHTPSLFTADPFPVEATGHLGLVVNNEQGYSIHVPGGSVDLSSTLVYVWVQPGPAMATQANHGFGIVLSDGTNIIQYNLGGSDLAAFRHNTGIPTYQCLMLDTASPPASFFAHAGSEASLNLAAITGIGAGFTTTLKAVGGTENCFIDIMRYGTSGLRVTGGTSGDPGKFAQVAAEDALTTDLKAHGVCRELGAGLFGLQGPLTVGPGDVWFEETDVVVVFEDRGVLTTRYKISIEDDGTNTTTFRLGVKNGTGSTATGTNGCILVAPSGVGGEFDAATDLDVTDVFIYGSTFSGFTQGISLRAGHEFIGGLITGSGAVLANGATMVNTNVLLSTVAADASALVWDVATDPNGLLDNMSFSKGANAHHAIELGTNSPTEVTFSGHTYTGFNASNEQNDSTIFVARTTGTVTINVVGGDIPSYKSAGATVDVVASVSYNLSGMNSGTEITILDRSVSMLDVNGTATALAFGDATTTERMGQSFEVATAGSAERIKLRIRKVGAPTDGVTVRLVNGVPGSAVLAESVPLAASSITTSFVEYDIDLTEKNALATVTTYGIEIQRTGAVDAANYYEIEYDTGDPHTTGTRYVYNAGWSTAAGDLLFEVMEAASENILFHVESSATSESWSHGGTARDIEVLALHQDYLPIVLLDTVGGADKDATLTQSPDRVFSNPA